MITTTAPMLDPAAVADLAGTVRGELIQPGDAVYDEAHPGFVNKYFDMLKAGGSKHHSELLAPFGLDASKPEFWNKGLKVIEGMIDELAAADSAA